MTISNDKPMDCCECRFEILGECRRNPPTTLFVGSRLDAFYPRTDDLDGCFAGEPKVKRSCSTCESFACCDIAEKTFRQFCEIGDEMVDYDVWHCCEWKHEEVSE